MIRDAMHAVTLLALAASCASRSEDDDAARALGATAPAGLPEDHAEAIERASEPREPEGQTEAAPAPEPTAVRRSSASVWTPSRSTLSRVDDGDESIWNDPDFRRRFVESYLAETEIEPPTVLEERMELQDVYNLLGEEKREEALAALQPLRQGRGANAVFHFTAGNVLLELGRFDEAADAYREAIDRHPKYRRAWVGLGETALRLEDFAGALPALVKVIELGGGDGLTYGMLGNAHSATGNHVSAESAYRMAALMDPERVLWRLQLARTMFLQERFVDAAALFAGLIREEPNNVSYWLGQAEAFLEMGEATKAAQNLEFVDGLGHANSGMLNTLGDIYTNEGLLDLAALAYLRAYEVDPAAGVGRAIRAAQDLWARGGGRHTLAVVQRVDELSGDRLTPPDEKTFLGLRARIALQGGADEEAATLLREIVALDPLDGDALLRLGDHHRAREEADQAIFYYERAQGIEVFRTRALMAQVRVLLAEGDDAAALPVLQQVARLDASDNVQKLLEQVRRRVRSAATGD